MRSLKKMQALQPQIAAINEKYKGLPMRDPRKQEQKPGNDGSVQEARRESGGRMRLPMLLAAPFLIRVLHRAGRRHRDARRELAVDSGPFAAGGGILSRYPLTARYRSC